MVIRGGPRPRASRQLAGLPAAVAASLAAAAAFSAAMPLVKAARPSVPAFCRVPFRAPGSGRRTGCSRQHLHLQAQRSPSSASASGPAPAPAAGRLEGATGLTLHLYDHCPYCSRVELVLGWRGVEYARAVYGYADMEGPIALSGKKVLPVLEWTDPLGKTHRMRESADIIRAIDGMDGPDKRIIAPKARRKELNAWQKRLRRVMHGLTRPRLLLMPIADFATQADVQYQKSKYIERGFDYEASLARTDELKAQVEAVLADFDPLLRAEDGLNLNGNGWSWDDLYTLPSLRVLTCVAGLQWPPKTLRYLEEAHAKAGVELYFEHAC